MNAAAMTVGECPWCKTFTTCSVIGISTPFSRAISRIGVQLLYASHVCRVMSIVSSTVNPDPMFSPKVRLRDSAD